MYGDSEGVGALGRKDGWKNLITRFPVNVKASVQSGQPLNFHSVYTLNGNVGHLNYVTPKGIIELEYLEGKPAREVRFKYHGNYNSTTAKQEVTRRFGLNDNMPLIYENINTDPQMEKAIKSLYGMRITHNEPWETTMCFVISQFNNIKRIKGIVRNLINKFGEDLDTGDKSTKLFPTPEALSSASIDQLKASGAGFRAKYIKAVATDVAENFDLGKINKMDYESGKNSLMSLNGVGDKVADCILLMGYKKLDAFPIDVWVKRSMEKIYFDGKKTSIKKIHAFASDKWGEHRGYAQQYLFHTARTKDS